MMPPFDVELQLRHHGDALRRLASQLLRGDADDAMQEVWLAALREPPRTSDSPGGWLRTVLLHVTRRWRRREARRSAKEAAAARNIVAEDHATVLAREEVAARLLATLSSLDAPFRDAIWQRYFEGKAPRAIAAASGVPVATVKSRLQRGLGMLRVRLGEEDRDGGRGDWRSAFAVAFGLEKGTAATAAVAGGVLMATWMKVAGAIAAAAVAVVLCWPGTVAPSTTAMTRDAADRPSLAVADLGGGRAAAPAAVASDAPRAEAPLAAPRDPKLATIRGRCVDEKGAPIAGCRARLNGWECSQERVDAWLRDHPAPRWENPPPQSTGDDGVFSFTFWPPPPYQFAIHVDGGAFAMMGARWDAIAEGRVVDVGQVVMVPGVRVQGRLIDQADAPVAKIDVHIDVGPEGAGEGETPSPSNSSGRTNEDGSFRCYSLVAPGPYRVQCSDGARLVNPVQGTLSRERSIEELVLVVRGTGRTPTITGRVVDEAGQPIGNATIQGCDPDTGHSVSTSSRGDGSFTLKSDGEAAGRVCTLASAHVLFERTQDQLVEWGRRDVVLTMRATGGIAVYVRDEDGSAITDFTVRAVGREMVVFQSSDSKVRARGPFASGHAIVRGIGAGKWTALIEFPTAMQKAPVVVPFEKAANDTLRIDAVAHANARRIVRVVDANDEPVAGSSVQLCLPFEGEFGETTFVSTMECVLGSTSNGPLNRALPLLEGATADDGGFVAVGPRGVALGICVAGVSHMAVRIAGVQLDAPEPLIVRVSPGARLRGALTPRAAIGELVRLGGVPKVELSFEEAAPGSGRRVPPVWADPGFCIADDGSFDIQGLPPGRWQVTAGVVNAAPVRLGEVDLRAGQTTQFDPDIAFLLPGTLKGVLSGNGAPLRNTAFQLKRSDKGPFCYVNGTTDAEGRYELRMPAGVYRAFVNRRGARDEWRHYASAESVRVIVGEVVEQPFGIWTGTVKLTLRDARCAPVTGLRVRITGADPSERTWMAPSDARGCIEGELLAEAVTFEVLPKALQSQEAQQRLREQLGTAGGDPVEARWMRIGTATITAGQSTKLELTLPPEWEK